MFGTNRGLFGTGMGLGERTPVACMAAPSYRKIRHDNKLRLRFVVLVFWPADHVLTALARTCA